MPTLKNWCLVEDPDNSPYTPPDLRRSCLNGEVFGHERFEDGQRVLTTMPLFYDAEADAFVTCGGSSYRLAEEDVDPEYEALYPSARRKLIQTLARQNVASDPIESA